MQKKSLADADRKFLSQLKLSNLDSDFYISKAQTL